MKRRDVAVLILKDHDKILLQKRSYDAERFPCFWGLFGGGVERGEKPEAALKREIYEELRLVLRSPCFVCHSEYSLPQNREAGLIHVYQESYSGDNISMMEGQEMRWVTIDEAMKMDVHPVYRDILIELI